MKIKEKNNIITKLYNYRHLLEKIIPRNSIPYRIFWGIQKSITTPKFPPHILKFHDKPSVRLFRTLGALSYTIIVIYNHFSFYLLVTASFISIASTLLKCL